MLRVTIELLPATGGPKRCLGIAEIGNDGTGDYRRGNYNVRLYQWSERLGRVPRLSNGRKRVWREAHVTGFPRLYLGPWDLLLRALVATVGDRNEQKEAA